jgi:hypothetical protein
MITRLKLKPGQNGTKKLVAEYGDALICVRYRYDRASCTRAKTVEIVVEKKSWTPPPQIPDTRLFLCGSGLLKTHCRKRPGLQGEGGPRTKARVSPPR